MSEWFENVFGFCETPENVYNFIKCEYTQENTILHDKANNRKYNAGKFRIMGIGDFPNMEIRGGGKIHLIHGYGPISFKSPYIDIFAAQHLSENDGATFMIPTNFNCLEFFTPSQTANDGISGYPYAKNLNALYSIVTGPSLLFRNYFVETSPNTIGQLEVELNLLHQTPISIIHGYPSISKSDIEKFKTLDFDWNDLNNYKIGIQTNCQVTTYRDRGSFVYSSSNHTVNQVFVSTFYLNYGLYSDPFTIHILENIIEAEYRSSILSTWLNSLTYPNKSGSNKLILSIIGSDIHPNPVEFACQVLLKCQTLIIESGLDIYLICNNDTIFNQAYPILSSLLNQTNGSIVNTK